MIDTHLINMAMAGLGIAAGSAILLAIFIVAVAAISKNSHVARSSQSSRPLTSTNEEIPAGAQPPAPAREPRELVLR